jgi:hypothetical protein
MYSLSQIRKGLRNPDMVLQELNRLYFDLTNKSEYYDEGINIFKEDWDNLIILDACRYDKFSERADLPGQLKKRKSQASMTHEWIRANFTDKKAHDTVYVSANGRFVHQQDETNAEVHEFVGLWDTDYRYGDRNLALPEMVTEHALEAAEEYPNKRLIVHYLQPHQPYIGPTGEQFEREKNLHKMMQTNDASDKLLETAYDENLDIVLDDLKELLASLPGKTVVTSDHGELLGEQEFPIPIRRYGHPEGIYVGELVDIPWLVYQDGERKEVVADESEDSVDYDEAALEEHLKNMGYRT